MRIPVSRGHAILSDEIVGHVVESNGRWSYELAGQEGDHNTSFATSEEAEAALRHDADQRNGERILAAGFVTLLALHPAFYLAHWLF